MGNLNSQKIESTKGITLFKVPEIFQLQYDNAGKEAMKLTREIYQGTVAYPLELEQNLEEKKGAINLSNPYFRNVIGKIYREITGDDVRPITAKESEIALTKNALMDNDSTHEDLGLVIYPNRIKWLSFLGEVKNVKLWDYLRKQVESNYKNINLDEPIVLTNLMDVVKDDRYENKLRFDLNEFTEAYNVPILRSPKYCFKDNDPGLQKTGFPMFKVPEEGEGRIFESDRRLYGAGQGICRLIRTPDLFRPTICIKADENSLDFPHGGYRIYSPSYSEPDRGTSPRINFIKNPVMSLEKVLLLDALFE